MFRRIAALRAGVLSPASLVMNAAPPVRFVPSSHPEAAAPSTREAGSGTRDPEPASRDRLSDDDRRLYETAWGKA